MASRSRRQRVDDYLHPERLYYSRQFVEKLDGFEYRTLNDDDAPVPMRRSSRIARIVSTMRA
jgi:signal peptidase I